LKSHVVGIGISDGDGHAREHDPLDRHRFGHGRRPGAGHGLASEPHEDGTASRDDLRDGLPAVLDAITARVLHGLIPAKPSRQGGRQREALGGRPRLNDAFGDAVIVGSRFEAVNHRPERGREFGVVVQMQGSIRGLKAQPAHAAAHGVEQVFATETEEARQPVVRGDVGVAEERAVRCIPRERDVVAARFLETEQPKRSQQHSHNLRLCRRRGVPRGSRTAAAYALSRSRDSLITSSSARVVSSARAKRYFSASCPLTLLLKPGSAIPMPFGRMLER
jgi:hypothetical protein